MTENENIFDKKQVIEIEGKGEVVPLNDVYEIENVAFRIQEIQKKKLFFENYKKKKMQYIDEEIKSLDKKISFLKDVILKTLQSNKEKSLTFPGSCQVITRTPRHTWKINDEDNFIKLVKRAKEEENILEEVKKTIIVKKEANKLLDDWEKSGKFKKSLEKVVEKNEGKTSVSITYIKEKEEEKVETNTFSDSDYDSLDF